MAGLLITALLLEAIAVFWAIGTLFECCYTTRRRFLHPLSGFAGLNTICLLIIILWFGYNYQDEFEQRNINNNLKSHLGYSYFFCLGAMLFSIGSFIASVLSLIFVNNDF